MHFLNLLLKQKNHKAQKVQTEDGQPVSHNNKERETTQSLIGKDVVVNQDGVIEPGSIFRVCLYVTQVNMRTNTDMEKMQIWTAFRSFLNEIGLPYTLVQLSQFVDIREYAHTYQEGLEKGHLTPELQQSGLKVVKFMESMDEDRNSRDYHGYVMFHYDPAADSIDSGVATGNAQFDELIGKFTGKKRMSEEEHKNLSRMVLSEAANITRSYAEQMGMQCWQLKKSQVYGLTYKILQKDSASFTSPEEASEAQCFTPFHDSVTAKVLAQEIQQDLQEAYDDAI